MNTWQISPAPNPQENNHMNSNVHWQEKNKILKGKTHRKHTPKYTVSNQIPKRTCPHWQIQLKGKKKKNTQKSTHHQTLLLWQCSSQHVKNLSTSIILLSFTFPAGANNLPAATEWTSSDVPDIYIYFFYILFYFIAILNVPSWVLSPCVKEKCTFLCFVYWWIIKIDLTDH